MKRRMRARGFYWIKAPDGTFTVAEFRNGAFEFPGSPDVVEEADLFAQGFIVCYRIPEPDR
jgi:hypothetical protein